MADHVLVNDSGDLLTDGEGGRVLWSSDDQFLGIIDDFRILSAVPTEDEAVANARRELDADEAADASVLCYLKFGEGDGVAAYDSSTYGHDATLAGTAQWVGLEGGAELAGTRKPQVWGIRRMRKGVLVNSQRNVFQVNVGPTQAILPRENGLDSLVNDGDFANIYDWTSTAGHYATQLSDGLVRVHELSDTIVLAFDVWGNVDPDRGYVETTAGIMRNLAARKGGLDDVEGVDTAAIAAAELARPDAVGIATGDAPVTILSMLNELAGGVDGWWTLLTRDSRFTIGLRAEPGDPEFELGVDDVVEDGLERISSAPPVRQWTLTYGDFEVTVPIESVAGGIPADQRSRYTMANLKKQSPDLGLDPAFLRRYRDAVPANGATLYDDGSACRRECERRAAIDRWPRDVYRAALPRGVFQYRVGQSGRVTWPRYGLAAGNAYRIGGHEEATDSGATTLFIWGRKL